MILIIQFSIENMIYEYFVFLMVLFCLFAGSFKLLIIRFASESLNKMHDQVVPAF